LKFCEKVNVYGRVLYYEAYIASYEKLNATQTNSGPSLICEPSVAISILL